MLGEITIDLMSATADGIDLSDITTARDESLTDEIAIDMIDIGIETEIENTGQLAIAQHPAIANATGVTSATIETTTTPPVHGAVATPTTEIDLVAAAIVTDRGMTADGPTTPMHDSALTTRGCMTG